MASIATIEILASVFDGDGLALNVPKQRTRFAPGAGTNGKREQVTLTASAFTALSPPAGAVAVILLLGQAVGLTLKGISGDTGVVLTPSTAPKGVPVVLPLSGASVGIASSNGSNQTVEVIWL